MNVDPWVVEIKTSVLAVSVVQDLWRESVNWATAIGGVKVTGDLSPDVAKVPVDIVTAIARLRSSEDVPDVAGALECAKVIGPWVVHLGIRDAAEEERASISDSGTAISFLAHSRSELSMILDLLKHVGIPGELIDVIPLSE